MLNKITNMFRSLIDFVTARPKLKFHVSFVPPPVTTEAEVKQHLHGFKVIKTDRQGKYTWKVTIRTDKTLEEVIAALSQRHRIQVVEHVI